MNIPWKVIDGFNYTSVTECVKDLQAKGYKVSEWILDIA